MDGSGDVEFAGRERFYRSVTNNSNHSKLTITDHPNLGTVATPYLAYGNDGLWLAIILTFNRTKFFEAFDNGKIDFEKIDQCLIQSMVGGCETRRGTDRIGQPVLSE